MVAGLDVLLLNFSFYAASALFTASISGIEEAFGATTAESTLGLSLFVIAYGIGPLIVSFSPVKPAHTRAFAALAKNLQTVLVLRFMGGFAGRTPISVGGASLMEIFKPNEFPYAIAFYAVSGVCGPILGPILGTPLLSGIAAFTTISTFFFLPETLSENIFLRRAKRHPEQTDNPAYHSEAEIQSPTENLALCIVKDMGDDLKLACLDPVILFVNMNTMLVYGVLVHWIAPIIGTAFFAPGFYLMSQSVLNYLGEFYPRHAVSVFAGNTFFRSSFGGALPLAALSMLNSLGIGWASSTLGFISVVMVPLPFILQRYGKKRRSWSRFAN
ncbi:Major Facilitator Superfamily protein [Aspergillus parasiticus SU-1]|uniref:Major Facilitator Superfamily protein n=1 Tax=Aspergillus parasiticus (strain ATCC 56775 / NRRL 5862 / SRRC 143 / SU-1) TaxID=1403190 RepID=A0A0F0IBC2_ASPPU|nr:Major Facilitator Superfamily protein [Aspergillus parasiticus SU-1]